MHLLPCEVIKALNLRPLWLIELPYSTDQKITCDLILRAELCVLAAACSCDLGLPFLLAVLPSSLLNGGVEANVLVQFVLLCYPDKVAEDLFL